MLVLATDSGLVDVRTSAFVGYVVVAQFNPSLFGVPARPAFRVFCAMYWALSPLHLCTLVVVSRKHESREMREDG